ncbi:hypothetical protein KC19_VG251100 [Ceratodon purpureus]|uniref:Uncharacterized protein n=1 Tax=Ceratodon purpureus TaxID=3225 RepID=A0A8T0HTB9_CERPU|nr:hypothetical protein KC19_VG251100 [Ceratodon purpureus]
MDADRGSLLAWMSIVYFNRNADTFSETTPRLPDLLALSRLLMMSLEFNGTTTASWSSSEAVSLRSSIIEGAGDVSFHRCSSPCVADVLAHLGMERLALQDADIEIAWDAGCDRIR